MMTTASRAMGVLWDIWLKLKLFLKAHPSHGPITKPLELIKLAAIEMGVLMSGTNSNVADYSNTVFVFPLGRKHLHKRTLNWARMLPANVWSRQRRRRSVVFLCERNFSVGANIHVYRQIHRDRSQRSSKSLGRKDSEQTTDCGKDYLNSCGR